MILGESFVFAGLLIILVLVPLYIYRKKIFTPIKRKGNLKQFIREVDAYLSNNYPKIKFDYSIIDKLNEEDNIKTKEILIIEDLVKQFTYQEYELSTQETISKNKRWNGYEQNSVLIKDNKLPKDWAQRKESAWYRDEGKCNRCGCKSKLADTHALLAKQMRNGGGFNLENVVILCNDCTRIIKSANLERTRKDLQILDNLMRKVSN